MSNLKLLKEFIARYNPNSTLQEKSQTTTSELFNDFIDDFKKTLETELKKLGGSLDTFNVKAKGTSTSNVTYSFTTDRPLKVKSVAGNFINRMIRSER